MSAHMALGGNSAASFFYLFAGRGRDNAAGNEKFFGKLAIAEDFYLRCSTFARTHNAALGKYCGGNRLTRAESSLKCGDIDDQRLVLNALLLVAAQFGQLFKLLANGGHDAVTGTSLLAFGAATGGLAALTAATDALAVRTLGYWFEFVKLHSGSLGFECAQGFNGGAGIVEAVFAAGVHFGDYV
jgi:hypothetical protein